MNTEHEIQLSDDLRHIVAGQSFEADIVTIERRGRKARRRTLAIRGVAGLGVLALAAGGVAIGLHSTHAPHTTAVASRTAGKTTALHVETVAYVIQQATAALDDETDFIIQEDTNNSGDRYTLWTDPQSGNTYLLEGSGNTKQESWGSTYLVDNVMHWKTTDVRYSTGTWDTLTQAANGPIQGDAPSAPYGGAGGTASQIKSWYDSGKFQIVGHGESNGHKVTKLQRPWAAGYIQIWVDSTTFQPVHIIMADFANTSGPLKDKRIVIDESWISRTPDMVNLTNNPRIPAGFKQVPPPR
jgi:hypothetical protein